MKLKAVIHKSDLKARNTLQKLREAKLEVIKTSGGILPQVKELKSNSKKAVQFV